jgi:hypothetical protein
MASHTHPSLTLPPGPPCVGLIPTWEAGLPGLLETPAFVRQPHTRGSELRQVPLLGRSHSWLLGSSGRRRLG